MTADDLKRTIPCPFCAEHIQVDAVLCRFCRSTLVGADGKRITAAGAASLAQSGARTSGAGRDGEGCSLLGAMVANAFCPGLGAWKLGSRLRGSVICLLILGCMAMYGMAYADAFNSEFSKAMKSGKTKALEKKMTEVGQNPWGTAGFWLYVYSFVDVWLFFPKKRP